MMFVPGVAGASSWLPAPRRVARQFGLGQGHARMCCMAGSLLLLYTVTMVTVDTESE